MTPAVVIRPIWLAPLSVNQTLPSGPAAICAGLLLAVGIGNSVTTPLVVIRPILYVIAGGKPLFSVNQRLPSGPAAIEPAERTVPAPIEK